MPAPCGGCPTCCKDCVFDAHPASKATPMQIIASKEAYGCIRPDGGAIVIQDRTFGMIRGEHFHPVTEAGAAFLRESGNPLAVHC